MIGYVAASNFALTLTSLATGAARESIAISNIDNKYDDYMIQLKIAPIATGTLAGDKACYIYFYGSADGTAYDDPCTGADAAIVIGTYHGLKGPFVVPMYGIFGTVYEATIGSVANFFGGNVPQKFGIVVENQTNAALNGTAGNFAASVTGVFYTT